MKILAIDIGQAFGWAVGNGVCGRERLKKKGEAEGQIYVKETKFLSDTNLKYGRFDLVVYELVDFTAGYAWATQSHGAIRGTMMMWCEIRGIPYVGVPVATIKAFACHGQASKGEMVFAAELFGYDPPSHDAADAACLWEYANKNYRDLIK